MTARPHRLLLLWFLLVAALPAYASGPPRPDGMIGVLLLFPVAIFGLRAAGAQRPQPSRTERVLLTLVLGICTLLTMAGGGFGFIPLLILLLFGLYRGGEAMRYGRGGKRWAIGAAMMVFTLLAAFNYLASLNYPALQWRSERMAAIGLREVLTAQIRFQAAAKLDANGNGVGEFGSIEQLQSLEAGGLSRILDVQRGYRFVMVLTGDPARDEKEFLAYATPVNYGDPPWRLSAMGALTPRTYYARTTFAVDESGVIRQKDLGSGRAVTREEIATWPEVD